MSLIKTNPMRDGNKFKLGVFGANANGCLSITKHPDRWGVKWDDVVAAAQISDRAGLDFSGAFNRDRIASIIFPENKYINLPQKDIYVFTYDIACDRSMYIY